MTGAFKKDPQRARERGAEVEGVGDLGPPPARFFRPSSYPCFGNGPTRLVELWEEIKSQVPPGLLTGSDRHLLEALCCVTAETERVGCKPTLFAQKAKLLAELGMTPRARAQLDIAPPAPEEDDKLTKFQRKLKPKAG